MANVVLFVLTAEDEEDVKAAHKLLARIISGMESSDKLHGKLSVHVVDSRQVEYSIRTHCEEDIKRQARKELGEKLIGVVMNHKV